MVKVLRKQNTTDRGINLHFIKFEYHYTPAPRESPLCQLDWELHITEDGMVEDVTGLLNKIFRSDIGSVLQTSMTPQSESKYLRKVKGPNGPVLNCTSAYLYWDLIPPKRPYRYLFDISA